MKLLKRFVTWEYQPVLHWAPNHYLSADYWVKTTYNAAYHQGTVSRYVELGSPAVSPTPPDADVSILIKSRWVFTFTIKGKWRQ